jgi:hypothetical protein
MVVTYFNSYLSLIENRACPGFFLFCIPPTNSYNLSIIEANLFD